MIVIIRRCFWLALAVVLCLGLLTFPVTARERFEGTLVAAVGAEHCGETWPFVHLIANLHVHTKLPGLDHLLAARRIKTEWLSARSLGFQVEAISNHSEELPATLWDETVKLAGELTTNTPRFVALASWEWTIGGLAPWVKDPVTHINGFGLPTYFGAAVRARPWGGEVLTTLEAFFARVAELDDQFPLAVYQINHAWAGTDHFQNLKPPKDFGEIRPRFALFEIDSGMTNMLREGLEWFIRALQQGWWVAPTINSDAEGGLNRADLVRSTGVWVDRAMLATDPTRAILEALLARRCYGRRSPAALQFGAVGRDGFEPMGGTIRPAADGSVTLEFGVMAPGGLPNLAVTVYEVKKTAVFRYRLQWRQRPNLKRSVLGHVLVEPSPETIAYFLVVRHDRWTLVSAPVWLAAGSVPSQPLIFRFSRHAQWRQRVEVWLNQRLVYSHLFAQDDEVATMQLSGVTDVRGLQIRTLAEVRPGVWRANRRRREKVTQQRRTIVFEDGQDHDYDDVVVEVRR